MSGFAGFGGYDGSLWEERFLWGNLCRRMCARISHRGGAGKELHVSPSCVMSCTVSSLSRQPFSTVSEGKEFSIVFDGSISNRNAVRLDLINRGYSFETETDAETVLKAYIEYGSECPNILCGSFSFVIDDTRNNCLFLCRDRFGAKPLFYTCAGDRIIFASEIKALLEYPGIRPVLDAEGLREVLGFGPLRTPGKSIFKNICELEPGAWAAFDSDGLRSRRYYRLAAKTIDEPAEDSVYRLRSLMDDIIRSSTDFPAYIFLTGTFCDGQISGAPSVSVIARDLPGLPGFDRTLTDLCRQIKEGNNSAICDFSSDMIFGDSCIHGIGAKASWASLIGSVIKPELGLSVGKYVRETNGAYRNAAPLIDSESDGCKAHRREYFLRISRYLPAMLEAADRCAMFNGLEIISPWADHRLIEYIYNLPAESCPDIMNRAGLTHSVAASPPCHTENTEKFKYVLCDSLQPIHKIISAELLCGSGKPDPRLVQYLMQVNYWLIRYHIYIDL